MRSLLAWISLLLAAALAVALFFIVRLRRDLAQERQERDLDRAAFADLIPRPPPQAGGPPRHGLVEPPPDGGPAVVDQYNAALERDPIWGPFFQKLERRRVLSKFNVLIDALHLPQDKVGPLRDLLVQRALVNREAVRRVRASGENFGAPEAIAAVAHATDDVDARIEALVGKDVARQLREWNSAIYTYGTAPDGSVAQDAVTLHEAGFELRTDQMVRLALIHYEVFLENFSARPGLAADPVDPKTGLTKRELQLFAREREVLTANEIAVLREWAVEAHKARAAAAAVRAHFVPAPTAAPHP